MFVNAGWCVKEWQSIIAHPAFVASHLAPSTSRSPKLLAAIPCRVSDPASRAVQINFYPYFDVGDENHIVTIELPRFPHPFEWHMHIPRPVCGLICLESSNCVHVFNPTTGYRFVVPPRSRRKSNDSQWTCLCYDPIVKEHKLLSSNVNFRSRIVENGIFSQGSKAWRMITDSWYHKRMTRDEVCLNGVLYYTAVDDESHCWLMKFYVNSERFVKGTVNLSRLPGRVLLSFCLQKSKLVEYFDRRVALVDYPELYPTKRPTPLDFALIKLWVLDEAHGAENWTLKTVRLPPAPAHSSKGFRALSLAGSVHAGEVMVFVCSVAVKSSEMFCFLYNAKTQVFTNTKFQVPIQRSSLHPINDPMIAGISFADHMDSLVTFP